MNSIKTSVIIGTLMITLVLVNSIKALESSTDLNAENNGSEKHHKFRNCVSWLLEPDDFILFDNGTVYVEVYNMSYNSSFYTLMGGFLAICIPKSVNTNVLNVFIKDPKPAAYITKIGLGISMFCLFIHIVVFALVKDLRNGPGWNLASLCVSLFCGYLFLLIGFDETIQFDLICIISAVLNHFFMLASFFWMCIIALDVYRSLLNATGKLRLTTTRFSIKRYGIYSLFSWGTALLFATCAVIADNTETTPISFRPNFNQTCWFTQRDALLAFFAAPVLVIVCANCVFFGLSVYTIFTHRLKHDLQDNHRDFLKKNSLMYIRLGVIMGVTWIMGFLVSLIKSIVIWYLFILLTTLQGLFIFLAFTCTPKTKKYFQELLKLRERRYSAQSLNPTFQSYCYYAGSFEKDLNNILISDKTKSPPLELFV